LRGFKGNFTGYFCCLDSYENKPFWAFKPVSFPLFCRNEETSMRVYIQKDRERLRVKVVYQGRTYQFSTGLRDTKVNRAFVQGIVSRIQLDMVSGQFDVTLVKYRPQIVGSNPVGITCVELFARFSESRSEEGLSKGALEKYRAVKANLGRYLKDVRVDVLSDRMVGNFVAALLENVTSGTARQYLYLLRAAWDWGKGQYPVKENLWGSQIGKLKPTPRKKRKPFTEIEVQAILKGFEEHRHYKHYHPFVLFQFCCGTRPGEASSLTWCDISEDFATATIGRSHSRGTIRQTTNTGASREIDIPLPAQALLRELKPTNWEPTALIFPAPKGGCIDDRLFARRAWKSILLACGVQHRPPYAARHTQLSHAHANGADPLELARQAGHSLRTLQDNYLGSVKRSPVFVGFGEEFL
jgi:integrase